MNAGDFRRIAMSLDGVEESSHMGTRDFRVRGRIFATLPPKSPGIGNLMLSPEQQAQYVHEAPDVFQPVAGGWGRMGCTQVLLEKADDDLLHGAIKMAWTRRAENKPKSKSKMAAKKRPRSAPPKSKKRPKSG